MELNFFHPSLEMVKSIYQTWNLEESDGIEFYPFGNQTHHGIESRIPLESANQTQRHWNSRVHFTVMWKAVERSLGPGFSRDKCEVNLVGTPLTHQRFLRRNRGTYGPAIEAGKESFPGHPTPIPQLYCCGDSTFPGIGVPAVAASGAIVANSLVSVSQHTELLDAVGI